MANINAAVASGVETVLSRVTAKGIEVWLRFAHEMNYYSTSGSQCGHYTGSVTDFQAAWKAMSDGMLKNDKIKMFWSPNSASSADLKQWYPQSGKVDVVGIDVYPKSQHLRASLRRLLQSLLFCYHSFRHWGDRGWTFR